MEEETLSQRIFGLTKEESQSSPGLLETAEASFAAGITDSLSTLGGIVNFFNEGGGNELVAKGKIAAEKAMQGIPAPQFSGTVSDYFDPEWWAYQAPRVVSASAPSFIAGGLAGAGVMGLGASALGASSVTAGATSIAAGLQQLGNTYNEVYKETKSHDKAFEQALRSGVATGGISAATLGMSAKLLGSDNAYKFMKSLIVNAAGEGTDQLVNNVITEKPSLAEGTLDSFVLGFASEFPSTATQSMLYKAEQAKYKNIENMLAGSPSSEHINKSLDSREPMQKAVDDANYKTYTAQDEVNNISENIKAEDLRNSEETLSMEDIISNLEQDTELRLSEANEDEVSLKMTSEYLKDFETEIDQEIKPENKLESIEQVDQRLEDIQTEMPESLKQKTQDQDITETLIPVEDVEKVRKLTREADLLKVTKRQAEDSIQQKKGIRGDRPMKKYVSNIIVPLGSAPKETVLQAGENLRSMISELGKKMGTAIFSGPSLTGSLGFSSPDGTITVDQTKMIEVAAHEIAHDLDRRYNFAMDITPDGKHYRLARDPYTPEIMQFLAENRQLATDNPGRQPLLDLQEATAEMIMNYTLNPEETKRIAPNFVNGFLSMLDGKDLEALNTFGKKVRAYHNSPAIQQIQGNMRLETAESLAPKTMKEKLTNLIFGRSETMRNVPDDVKKMTGGFLNKFTEGFIDEASPVVKLIDYVKEKANIVKENLKEDPLFFLRTYRNADAEIETALTEGMPNFNGVPGQAKISRYALMDIFDVLDSSSKETLNKEVSEMLSYGVAKRSIQKLFAFQQERLEFLADERVKLLNAMDAFKERVGDAPMSEWTKQQKKQWDKLLKADENLRRAIAQASDIRNFVASGTGSQMKSEYDMSIEALNEIENDPAKQRRFDKALAIYDSHADGVLKYLVQAEVLSPESYSQIKANNPFYISFERVAGDGYELGDVTAEDFKISKGLGNKSSDVIKALRGSEKELENPLVSLMKMTKKAIYAGHSNGLKKSLASLAIDKVKESNMLLDDKRNLGYMIQEIKTDQYNQGDLAKLKKDQNIFFYKKTVPVQVETKLGTRTKYVTKEKAFRLAPEFSRAFRGVQQMPEILKVFTILPDLQRFGITRMPAFQIRQIPRDLISQYVLSKGDTKLTDLKNAFGSKFREKAEILKKSGAGFLPGYFYSEIDYYKLMDEYMNKAVQSGKEKTIFTQLKDLGKAYNKLADSNEMRARVLEYDATYKKLKEQGYSDISAHQNAVLAARDLVDFAVSGKYIKALSRFIPFLNAQIQGTVSSYRRIKANPQAVAQRFMFAVVLPTLMVRLANKAAGNDEEYQQLPTFQRDMFWNFKIGDTWLSIPKPYELGVMASSVDRLIDAPDKGMSGAYEDYLNNLVEVTLPLDASYAMGPFATFIKAMVNRDTFRNRDIVPHFEEQMDVENRKGAKNATVISRALSETQKGIFSLFDSDLGKALQVDPRKIDFIIKDSLGYLGDNILRTSDVVLNPEKRKGMNVVELAGAGIGRLSGLTKPTPGFNSVDVQWVIQQVKRRGKKNVPGYSRLEKSMQRYFIAKPSQKERAAKEMQKIAESIRGEMGL